MKNSLSVEKGIEKAIRDHKRIREVIHEDNDYLVLEVDPFGNTSLFGSVCRSSRFTIGNVATTNDGNLKVNLRKLY